jgi:hypothetical protein
MKIINYKKMLEEINNLVDNDFCAEMEMKGRYTQKEAKQMADIITKVYSISHCISCSACSKKYDK